MANIFETPNLIASEALHILQNNLVAANLFYRDKEAEFRGAKIGDSVTIRKPAEFEAKDFTGTIDIQDISEGSVSLVIDQHKDISVEVTSKQKALDINSFAEQVITPAMIAMAQEVDYDLLSLYTEVPYTAGTAGSPLDSLEDAAELGRVMNVNKIPNAGRLAVIDPTTNAKMLSVREFMTADKRGDDGTALRNASFGYIMGIDWYMDQNVHTHTKGTAEATLSIDGAVAEGATTMTLANAGDTKTLVVGDVFTVADTEGSYVITEAATSTGLGAMTGVKFYPAAPAGGFADTKVLTLVGDHTASLAFNQNAFALAMIPLEETPGATSSTVFDNGIGIRMVQQYDINTKKDIVSFDLMYGRKTIQPEYAVRLLG